MFILLLFVLAIFMVTFGTVVIDTCYWYLVALPIFVAIAFVLLIIVIGLW